MDGKPYSNGVYEADVELYKTVYILNVWCGVEAMRAPAAAADFAPRLDGSHGVLDEAACSA